MKKEINLPAANDIRDKFADANDKRDKLGFAERDKTASQSLRNICLRK